MRRWMTWRHAMGVISLVVVAVLALGGCTTKGPKTTTPTTTSTPTSAYTIKIASKAGIGDYLVDGKGMTLYYYSKDASGKSMVPVSSLVNWPPFSAGKFVVPSPLSASNFSVVTSTYGLVKDQTTYKGWPLYYYAKDVAAGDTLGSGLGGVWFVVSPSMAPAP
jgi:predicted lipoprotein with Yx(FWY)xxD motif